MDYMTKKLEEMENGHIYVVFYETARIQMVEQGSAARDEEIARDIRGNSDLNDFYAQGIRSSYLFPVEQVTLDKQYLRLVILDSVLRYKMDWNIYKKMNFINTFPLILRFHYSKKCKAIYVNKRAVAIICRCQPYRSGRARDYRLEQYTGFCNKFGHTVLTDGVGYRYNFIPAVKSVCTKYRKKSDCVFGNKRLISTKNWNRAVLRCEGFVTDKFLVTSMYIRSFLVKKMKKSGRGPPGSGLTYFPHTGGDFNECECQMHQNIIPISVFIENINYYRD